MDFLSIARSRQSTRVYDGSRSVEREKLVACLEAARLAPSACNSQPWHFTVCIGDAAKRIAPCTQGMGMNPWTNEVPVFVVVSEAPYNLTAGIGAAVKRQDFKSNDIGIAAAYFTAEAAAQGLGTCILGWFDQKKLAKACGCSGRIHLVIAVGYPKEGDKLREKSRREFSALVDWVES
ncbi:MAG TPA: nitroreductase family protein [Candidatus Treponema faecavium]|nr:nitroreductase family protein [Candidatus Treponema faecavium]